MQLQSAVQMIMTHIVRLAPGRKPACPRTRKRRQVPRGDPGRSPLPPQTGRANDRSAWPWLPATIAEQCRPDYPCCFRDSSEIRPRTTLGGAATPTSTTATRQPWPGSCCGSAAAPPSTPASPTGAGGRRPSGSWKRPMVVDRRHPSWAEVHAEQQERARILADVPDPIVKDPILSPDHPSSPGVK